MLWLCRRVKWNGTINVNLSGAERYEVMLNWQLCYWDVFRHVEDKAVRVYLSNKELQVVNPRRVGLAHVIVNDAGGSGSPRQAIKIQNGFRLPDSSYSFQYSQPSLAAFTSPFITSHKTHPSLRALRTLRGDAAPSSLPVIAICALRTQSSAFLS